LREWRDPLISFVVDETRRQRRTNAHQILAEDSGSLPAAKRHNLLGISPDLLSCIEAAAAPLNPYRPATPARKASGRRGRLGNLLSYCSTGGRGRG
jgi:hypothetical protein